MKQKKKKEYKKIMDNYYNNLPKYSCYICSRMNSERKCHTCNKYICYNHTSAPPKSIGVYWCPNCYQGN